MNWNYVVWAGLALTALGMGMRWYTRPTLSPLERSMTLGAFHAMGREIDREVIDGCPR